MTNKTTQKSKNKARNKILQNKNQHTFRTEKANYAHSYNLKSRIFISPVDIKHRQMTNIKKKTNIFWDIWDNVGNEARKFYGWRGLWDRQTV